MDARSERLFIQNFKNQALDSTLVLITHRTSLLALVDRVIIVDSGKVIGTDTVDNFLNIKALTADSVDTKKRDLVEPSASLNQSLS